MAVLEGVRFVQEIQDGLKAPHRNLPEHPLIEKINRRELTRHQLKGLMIQLTLQTTDIVRWIGAMYADCPYPAVRRQIFLNLCEEELGSLSQTAAHFELCADSARALGATEEELAAARPLPATHRMMLHGEMCLRHRGWLAGLGSSLGVESQTPLTFQRIAAGLRAQYGLGDEAVRFFDVHVTADEDHGSSMAALLIEHATTEELQRLARDAAWTGAECYHGMLSTYEAYA
jgi:pyrroloquinoline-quinone synthase